MELSLEINLKDAPRSSFFGAFTGKQKRQK
jgi:hypothetical protein